MDRSQKAKTIADEKAAFIRTQIRLLSAILRPSEDWRDHPLAISDDDEDEDEAGGEEKGNSNLSEKVVADVMTKGWI